MTVIGLVEALIHASSSATDTDFTAKLLDVQPDGRAISLTHVGGVLRARYRKGFGRIELLEPRAPAVFRISLSHVGHTFLPGHRIRVEISSSCFPLVDPNPWDAGGSVPDERVGWLRAAQVGEHREARHVSGNMLTIRRNRRCCRCRDPRRRTLLGSTNDP